MNKTFKKRFMLLIYVALLICTFRYGKPTVEEIGREMYYKHVHLKFISSPPKIDKFQIGFYKPELPFSHKKLVKLEKDLNFKNSIVSVVLF